MSKGYYSDDFHIYEVVWTPEHIAIKIDGMLSTHIIPPPGGFWEIGNFNREDVKLDNIWKEGSKMAPFDASVSKKINILFLIVLIDCIKPVNTVNFFLVLH